MFSGGVLSSIKTAVGIVTAILAIIITITTYASGQLNDLKKYHNNDMKKVQQSIDQQTLESYSDKLLEISLMPDTQTKTQLLQHYRNKKADVKSRMNAR